MTHMQKTHNFFQKHRNTVILLSLLVALSVVIITVLAAVFLTDNHSKDYAVQKDVTFFIPKTVTTNGESLDTSFMEANSLSLSPQLFLNNRALSAGDFFVMSDNDGSIFISDSSGKNAFHYKLNTENTVTALSHENQLIIAYRKASTDALTTYSPSSGKINLHELYCAAGDNLGRVYSNGERIYYVDRKNRTVCSVLPFSNDVKNESIVRVSAFFVNINTVYYAVGDMLYMKKPNQKATWLYECPGYVLDILATESCVYFSWENEQNALCAARLDIYTGAYTPLSGNPTKD